MISEGPIIGLELTAREELMTLEIKIRSPLLAIHHG
jgi:hypothetical protein